MKKTTTLLFSISLFLYFAMPAGAEILFEDSFNGFTNGWTPSVGTAGNKLYPWTADETFDPDDPGDDGGGVGGISNYEPSIHPENERTNSNSWNGWVEHPASTGTISIQATGGVGDSPVLRLRLVKYAGLSNELGLNKWLGNTQHQALYIQYKVKFGSTGDDFWWGGQWSGGNPTAGNIIWKFGRVWTGFNPTDYDKTLGQSQPVEDSNPTNESNWRTGIWIFRWMATDWNTVKNSAYFDVANFHYDETCDATGHWCDSQSATRDALTGNIWDWAHTSSSRGRVNVFANSTNPLESDGSFSEIQGWHTVEMYFKNRSRPDTADGAMRIWIDGTEITQEADISPPILASMSGNPNDYGMNFVRFGDNFNNLTSSIPDSPGHMDVFIDDVVISTQAIGYDYVIGDESEEPDQNDTDSQSSGGGSGCLINALLTE